MHGVDASESVSALFATQCEHDTAPAAEKEPGSHATQGVAESPSVSAKPDSQRSQPSPSAPTYAPAAHGVRMGSSATHGVDGSASVSLKPLGHGVHKLAPAGEKLPTSQLVHAASSAPLYVPPAQGTHGVVASPSSSAKPPPHTYSVVDPVGGAGGAGVSHSSGAGTRRAYSSRNAESDSQCSTAGGEMGGSQYWNTPSCSRSRMLCCSQVGPTQPWVHEHANDATMSVHVAPFLQGESSHSSTSRSQRSPSNPGGHSRNCVAVWSHATCASTSAQLAAD